MSVKEQKKKPKERVEDIRYSGAVPKEVLDEMTPEIITQYYLWDEVTKREIELYPWLILPLIREVFGRSYPKEVEIKLIATEYVVRRIHKGDGSTLSSIYADIAMLLENRDVYHLESQMKTDGGLVLRMLEYDIHMGLAYGTGSFRTEMAEGAELEIRMPRSAILYLGNADNVQPEETCLIRFADNSTHTYRVPVVKVQGYTPQMIGEKHLAMLIPFLPIRFRRYLGKKKSSGCDRASEEVKKELTEFIRECIMIIDREKRNGELTELAGKDIMEFLSITCSHLLKDEPELNKEVHGIMEPTILLTREKAAIEIKLIREQAEEEKQQILEQAEEEKQRILEQVEEEKQRILEQMEEEKQQILEQVTKEKQQAKERLENSIRNFVERNQKSGQNRQQIKEDIQAVFSLEETQAEEKMRKYWKS